MVEEFRYQSKRKGEDVNDKDSLQNLVNEEFKEIDKYRYRDDQEILNAGWNVVNKLIEEMKKDKSKVCGPRALEPLTKLISALKIEYNNMKGMKLFTNNKDKINQIAQKIDDAENETLERLAKNRTTQDSRDLVKKGNEQHKDKAMFLMEGGNDVKKQTGNIIFTKASNPIRIDQALDGLFDNPNIVYEIDYSGCTNQKIKDKMVGLAGTQTCYLRYDEEKKTYTIRDKDGNGISQRAYIREGVKLIPAGVREWKAYTEEKRQNEKLGNIDKSHVDALTQTMIKDIPSATKKLNEEQQKELVEKTENRIAELLRKAKNLGYGLESECISKKYFGNGYMELHLNSGSSEVDRTIWENKDTENIGEYLYNFIGGNAGEYKTYLTKRVKQKRQELDSLTKTETINIERNQEINGLNEEELKQKAIYGIGLLEKMVDNYRETEGDSWLDNDDKKLVQIKQLIRNAEVSIANSKKPSKDAIIKNFVDPIREKWRASKNMDKNNESQYNQLKNIFFGTKEEQISAIRNLGGRNRMFDKTETSFLAEEIEGNDDLTVKNTDIKECINNIKTRFPDSIFDKNGNIIPKRKEQFDKMFTAAAKGTDSLISLLVNSKILPANRKDEESEVRNCVENLKNQLNTIDKQSEIPNITASIKQKEKAEKLRLKQKSNKTEEDIQRLQALTFLENHPEQRDTINQEVIERTRIELRYLSLGDTVKSCLFPALAELGGGAEGKNSDIYNDIKGYGFGNLSDENAKKWSQEIIEDIIIEVAITAISIALAPTGAGEAIYISFRVAKASTKGLKGLNKLRKSMGVFSKSLGKKMATQYASKFSVESAKAAKGITRASHIVTSTEKGIKGLNIVKRTKDAYQTIKATETFGSLAGKLAMKGGSMTIEGITFHINSTVIHNAIQGKDLGEGLNPFGYTEGPNGERISNYRNYIQSVAFLGVLKTLSKPIQGLTGNMAKQILREKYDANTLAKMFNNAMSITGEMESMMGTDQILSLTFDQKFKPVTAEDLVSMFGMVAGLRLTNKVYVKIQEYDRKSVTVEMKQGDNTFNVKIDREGNVLKVEGKDKSGNKIENPQEVLGIRSGVEGQNLRETHNGKEVGTVKGNLNQLNNLHEGDIITVRHGENDVKFKKNKSGNREIIDAGNIESDRFKPGEEYVAKENQDGSGYHLETKTQGGPKFSLDGKVGVKLGTHISTHSGIEINNGELNNEKELRLKEQEKYKSEIENAQKRISELPEELRSESIKKLLDSKDISELSPEEIKEIQKEIGLKGNNINGIFDGKSLKRLKYYINQKKLEINNANTLGEKRETAKTYEEKLKFLIENFHINGLTKIEIESLGKEQIIRLKELKDLGVNILSYTNEISKLGPEEINTLRQLKDLGIDIHDVFPLYGRDLISYKPEEIQKLKELKDLGIDVSKDISRSLKLTADNIDLLKNLKEIGLNIKTLNLEIFGDQRISDIYWSIPTLKELKNIGLDINEFDLSTQDIATIYNIEGNLGLLKELSKIGFKFDKTNINEVTEAIDNSIFDDGERLILKTNSSKLYEGYNYSKEEIASNLKYKKGSIIEGIQQYIQNAISENRNIFPKEIVDKIRPELLTIPPHERFNILKGIHEVVIKFNLVKKYTDFEHGTYKNAKELLCAMRGITKPEIIAEITNDIKVIQYGTGLTFFVGDPKSYDIIYGKGETKGENSAGFNSLESEIEELEGTLSVVNGSSSKEIERVSKGKGTKQDMRLIERRLSGKDPHEEDWVENRRTVIHEGQHNTNRYFMGDKESYEKISRSKDEITANLREGSTIEYIEKVLTEPKSEGGSYQYEGLIGEKWEAHKAQVRELLKYAKDLVELSKNPKTGLTKDKIISMLSDVPAEGRKDLHANITEAVRLHTEKSISQSKIKGLREKFISMIKKLSGNNRLITDLMNRWNSLYPSYGIQLEEFWRAGTTKKETVIQNLRKCKNIEEIKYILNDPKNSHISWGPNNNGGMEISDIINGVLSGNKKLITFIPPEIRPQVQRFMN